MWCFLCLTYPFSGEGKGKVSHKHEAEASKCLTEAIQKFSDEGIVVEDSNVLIILC